MSDTQAWGFTDDRGAELGAARVPQRVVAYARAGAALFDLGVTPVAVYGSGHDGAALDPAKAGGLGAAGVPYLGPGRSLDEAVLEELRPEVIVDVTYDGKSPYALDEAVAGRLGVPLVVLSVGDEPALPAVLGRFAALGRSLGAEPAGGVPDAELDAAEAALRGVAARSGLTVLALSGAGPEQVHLARPEAWPELARLVGLGVRLLDPGPGPGANWLTADRSVATGLRPDLVLFDAREHATPPCGFPAGVRLVPWSPEIPPSAVACARFFRVLTEALAT
ncbi:ABC transporter substrate-binding protein [Streptomyces sp. NPDC058872]|uniref:ABC transporter substrate-binding protein n=1 Tax=Streptomyces sp. NPDC058872 TaxID=3346661 RepID=UPI0036C70FF7